MTEPWPLRSSLELGALSTAVPAQASLPRRVPRARRLRGMFTYPEPFDRT